MPGNKSKSSKRGIKKGGGLLSAPSCAQQVDISRYTRACGSDNQLPLDGLFQKHFPQSAGGFSILPDTNIGNLAEVRGYSDCCPPVLSQGGIISSTNFQPLCGGGKKSKCASNCKVVKTKRKTAKRKLTKKSRKSLKGGKPKKHHKKSSIHKKHSGKKHSSKGKKIKGKKNRKQSGGNDTNSHFSGDMTTRQFDCVQPVWSPKCT